jgi:hypothetical protein
MICIKQELNENDPSHNPYNDAMPDRTLDVLYVVINKGQKDCRSDRRNNTMVDL